MALSYFGFRLSENIVETPEGFLVCADAVIARTGYQTYKVGDLPSRAADLGVDVSDPRANIDLYRSPEQVFAPETIASFEGKPVTDEHPDDFVDPNNYRAYAMGHVQNVRRSRELLESGDEALVADIYITVEPLISKVRSGQVRELSCGYDYSIEREGNRILQVAITGNHVAVVPKGRAGSEARINDAAPGEQETVPPPDIPTTTPQPMRKATMSFSSKLMRAIGFQNWAKDAKPEEVAEALDAIQSEGAAAKAKDADEEEKKQKAADKAAADAKAAKDAEEEEAKKKKEAEDKGKGKDAKADAIAQAIDALKAIAGDADEDEEEESEEAEDAEESEEAEDGEHCEDADEEEEKETGKGKDRAAANDAAEELLTMLRPIVARSKDKALRAAYNRAADSINRKSRASSGSYAGFAGAARAKGKDAGEEPNPMAQINRLQKAYDESHGKVTREVK